MIDRVDTFVYLDSTQVNKRSWQQRNKIKTPQGELWLTIPIQTKGKREQLIHETLILKDPKYPEKILQTITLNYSRAPFFKEYRELVFDEIQKHSERLCDLNIGLIEALTQAIGINRPKLIRSSTLSHDGTKADLLVAICQAVGSQHYLSAPGSKQYIEESGAFQKANIEVTYHEYQHPSYAQQFGAFAPYMSVIDLLFNEGPRSLEIIRSGVEKRVA